MNLFEAIILAIIEGITEFLPVSSTGHMIIGSSAMGIASDDFVKLFTVAIQFGAILSVVVLYYKRFFKSLDFYFKLAVGFIPAGIAGLLFKDHIELLLENVQVVAFALLAGGVVFLFIDKLFPGKEEAAEQEVTYRQALIIGCFQVIAMIPGVSRSAATIIGGLTQKLSRKTAAEFSFFLAVPTMLAASSKSLLDYIVAGGEFTAKHIQLFTVGNLVAFAVAVLAIKGFIALLNSNGFRIFGYYRILIGGLILILIYAGYDLRIID
ncbi:MAG: undecaprenyl-diphosphate phosphatase [Bacteroidia bacterium]|nr:undecaprenyl-diphosphate phosphatase [Bacteroidia bacterium]